MKIQRKRGALKSHLAFIGKTALLLTLSMTLFSTGYLLAEKPVFDNAALMSSVVAGSDNLSRDEFFIGLRSTIAIPAFGIGLLVFIILSLGHFFTFGPKDMSGQGADDGIAWWTLFERIIHWILAVVFVILMISGLQITFGRYLGGGGTTLVFRQFHEFAGFLYVPTLVIVVFLWLKEALPKAYDLEWVKHAGGYLGYKGSLKSGKFNAGQKLWYWVMAVCSVLLGWSGLFLFFEVGEMSTMRFYVVLHFLASIPMILMFLVHLYMTTLGAKGALMGMFNGKMSKKAAQAYHSENPSLSDS